MATDYDVPHHSGEDDLETDSLEGLKAAESGNFDVDDDGDLVESYDLPSVDLGGEDINITVIPRREDEFTCGSCFLVQRRNRIDHVEDDGTPICKDCA